ncbi:MAG: DUF58 domain-containing protein [Deltaproteobacteria bacterium]|nr:DUF58 domain-containing protein [Deltaproteobacteria bacterium]
MPSLSATGKLSLLGGVTFALGGLLGAVDALTTAGTTVLAGLGFAWALTVPLPRRMRRERLEFSWWIVEGVRRADHPVTVRVALRNPTDRTLTLGAPRLSLSPGLRHARWKGSRVEIPAKKQGIFDLEVRPGHAGRHVLHGAWLTLGGPLGLTWAPLYFPNPLVLEVGPRSATASFRRTTARPQPSSKVGRSTRREGEGAEIRELREHQPGDPFHRIAWKATARRGRLMVRETEDDAQTTRVIVLDAGPAMRGDLRGGSKLDYATELIAQACKLSAIAGDPLGLIAFDTRITAIVQPSSQPSHFQSLLSQSLEQRMLVDEDLTDVDDEQLEELIARYFREQEGLIIRTGVGGRERLAQVAAEATRRDPLMRIPVRAKDETARILRAFCRARAIPLPLRYDSSGATRLRGLEAAMRAATENAREPRTVIVLSDLDPFDDGDALRSAFSTGQGRGRRHRVTVVAPMGGDFVPTSDKRDASTIRDALLQDERLRVEGLRHGLSKVGVPLYFADKRNPFAHWLARASAPRIAQKRR